MRKVIVYWFVLFIISFVPLTLGGTYAELEAEYSIASEQLVDPDPEAVPDRLVLWITGDSAKEIFVAMPTTARNITCDGTEDVAVSPTKTAGGLECTGDEAKGYVCTVAIALGTGETTRGYVCD